MVRTPAPTAGRSAHVPMALPAPTHLPQPRTRFQTPAPFLAPIGLLSSWPGSLPAPAPDVERPSRSASLHPTTSQLCLRDPPCMVHALPLIAEIRLVSVLGGGGSGSTSAGCSSSSSGRRGSSGSGSGGLLWRAAVAVGCACGMAHLPRHRRQGRQRDTGRWHASCALGGACTPHCDRNSSIRSSPPSRWRGLWSMPPRGEIVISRHSSGARSVAWHSTWPKVWAPERATPGCVSKLPTGRSMKLRLHCGSRRPGGMSIRPKWRQRSPRSIGLEPGSTG